MGCCFTAVSVIVILLVIFKIILKLTTGWDRSPTCLVGKTAIVTGANAGIGFYTAQDFAKRGARVILACRNAAKAEEAKERIIEATGNSNVVVKLVDFESLASVRKFAKDINNTEKQLDILVNNAGAAGLDNENTGDGLNVLMQVNYFGPFLLTLLLIDLLKNSAPSRIVNVSSVGSRWADLDVNDLNAFPVGKAGIAINYANSKLCNVLFTNELARKLQGSGVTTNSLHPGAVRTEIFRRAKGFIHVAIQLVGNMFFKTSEEGAQTSIYLAVSKNLEGVTGQYFADCRLGWLPPKQAQDEGLAKKLWEKSVELVKLTPDECKL